MRILIVGSGLGGASVANELAQMPGFHVTVVERGSYNIRVPNDIVFTNREFGIAKSHSINVGGTTALWHGGLMPMSREEFDTDLYPSPISYDELNHFYSEVLLESIGKNPFHNNGNYIDNYANSISTVGIAIPNAPAVVKVDPRVHLIYNANIKHFNVCGNQGAPKIRSCTVESDGILQNLDADVFILSAGGLNSPIILKDIVERSQINLLNIGNNLTDHPMGFIGKIRLKQGVDVSSFMGVPISSNYKLRTGFSYFDKKTSLSHCFYLRPSFTMKDSEDIYLLKRQLATYRGDRNYIKILSKMWHPDIIAEALSLKTKIHIPTRIFSVLAVTEQKPINSRSIKTRDDQRVVDWSVENDEINSIQSGISCLLKALSPILEDTNITNNFSNRLWSAAHYSGGCRISRDLENGVVDPNLRVHGFDNLYVCDGSVIPKTGYSNTGITIVALAKRLGLYLKNLN